MSIDGSVVTADLDEYSPSLLSNGPHTITISVLETKDFASSNSYVIVDAFVVGVPGSGIYDDADPYLQYTGHWGHNEINQRYAGTQSFSNTPGDSVSLTFTGTQVAYLYQMQENLGHVHVSIDGAVVTADLDEYTSHFVGPYPLRMSYQSLSAGTHTITVTITGVKDTAASNSYGLVDGFIVSPDASPYDDTDRSWLGCSGEWTSNIAPGRYMGTQTFSNMVTSTCTFTFTGTKVAYIFEAQPNLGRATVSIDGTAVDASLDEYSASPTGQRRAVYSGLARGPHQMTITVQGIKDANATNSYVVIDGFDVTP